MNLAGVAAILYGIIAIAGGAMGYIKSQSKISLISGGISGLLLVVAGIAAVQGQPWGLILATAIAAVLIVTFAIRWWKTRKLMPAGLMILLGAITCSITLLQL